MIRNKQKKIPPNLRYIKRKKSEMGTAKVNKVISIINTDNIIDKDTLMRAAANKVAKGNHNEEKELLKRRKHCKKM